LDPLASPRPFSTIASMLAGGRRLDIAKAVEVRHRRGARALLAR
jgi:hypothetical protein